MTHPTSGLVSAAALTTVYMIGSIRKTFLATAVLQLHEQSQVYLDGDVNAYLPFPVRHPEYPDRPVTVRMLLTHTAGLVHDLPDATLFDSDEPMLRWMSSNLGFDVDQSLYDQYPTLDEHLASFFQADGTARAAGIWMARPGATCSYSNLGSRDLLGKVIEGASGQPAADYVEARILEPLGLDHTSFEASHFDEDQLAVPHVRRTSGGYRELPLTGMSASGQLRTTVVDLARFMMMSIGSGATGGVRILEPASMEIMLSRTVSLGGYDFNNLPLYGMGLGWQLWGEGLQGHGGAVPGFLSEMIFQQSVPEDYGVILMMNTGCSLGVCDREWLDSYFYRIRDILLEEASTSHQQ